MVSRGQYNGNRVGTGRALLTAMGTANNIAAFRPVQTPNLRNDQDASGIHNGYGSQVKVSGLNNDQVVHGSKGNGGQGSQTGYGSREFPFPVQMAGESHYANIQGVNTFRSGSMQLTQEAKKLIGSPGAFEKPIRALGIPNDFNQQIHRQRMNAHLQTKPGSRLAAFKANPSRFAMAIRA